MLLSTPGAEEMGAERERAQNKKMLHGARAESGERRGGGGALLLLKCGPGELSEQQVRGGACNSSRRTTLQTATAHSLGRGIERRTGTASGF